MDLPLLWFRRHKAEALILALVSSERFLPINFARAFSERGLPLWALLNLALVSSECFLSLNFLRLSNECLNPKEEPATCKILYSGFKRSK
jgi:hypothetical protein